MISNRFADPVDRDSTFVEALDQRVDNGDPFDKVPIAELTDFDWTSVYVFDEWSKKSDVDATIGAGLFGSDDEHLFGRGVLVVFMNDDDVAHAAWVNPPPFVAALMAHQYASDAWISRTEQGNQLVIADTSTLQG